EVRQDLLEVVAEPAPHSRKLPKRDLGAPRNARHVLVDRIVQPDLALVDELQNGGDDEGLGHAADARVEVGGHLLATRGVANAERARVGWPSIAPHPDNRSGDRRLLQVGTDRFRERGIPIVHGMAPCQTSIRTSAALSSGSRSSARSSCGSTSWALN